MPSAPRWIVTLPAADAIRLEANYFEKNAHRMRYPGYRRQETVCRLGRHRGRLKDRDRRPAQASGMFWTVRGANGIIALRCNRLSRKFADYWASRHEAA